MDKFTKEQRHKCMSRIRGKDTWQCALSGEKNGENAGSHLRENRILGEGTRDREGAAYSAPLGASAQKKARLNPYERL